MILPCMSGDTSVMLLLPDCAEVPLLSVNVFLFSLFVLILLLSLVLIHADI